MRNSEILARFDKKINRLHWGKRFLWLAAMGNFALLLALMFFKRIDSQGYIFGSAYLISLFSSAAGFFIIKDALELEKEAQDYIMIMMPMENPLFRMLWFRSPIAVFFSARWSAQLTLAPLVFMMWIAPLLNFILVAWT